MGYAPVRLVFGDGGGTGTFASPNGLILTNHHVALDCIRTSTLAEQNKDSADNLIEKGFTAKSQGDELACKRFKAQVERSARDVTAEVNAGVTPGMDIAEVQRVRQAARSDLERACQADKGGNFSCDVVDFNSGAQSLLITYEDYKDIRLVYAPEKQGYFGGDEMNFRFPRYVSDISILRAYQGTDGAHSEYHASHVPVKPSHALHVSMDGVKDGEFTIVAGSPGNTNRYRESYSAEYNLRKGNSPRVCATCSRSRSGAATRGTSNYPRVFGHGARKSARQRLRRNTRRCPSTSSARTTSPAATPAAPF